MSAYATRQREQRACLLHLGARRSEDSPAGGQPRAAGTASALLSNRLDSYADDVLGSVVDVLIDRLVERLATEIAARLGSGSAEGSDEWFDSRQAAEYLGLHRDTLRRLAAARAIPTEQDGRGCKLFFRRSSLDDWRRSGGRVAQLSALADAA